MSNQNALTHDEERQLASFVVRLGLGGVIEAYKEGLGTSPLSDAAKEDLAIAAAKRALPLIKKLNQHHGILS